MISKEFTNAPIVPQKIDQKSRYLEKNLETMKNKQRCLLKTKTSRKIKKQKKILKNQEKIEKSKRKCQKTNQDFYQV